MLSKNDKPTCCICLYNVIISDKCYQCNEGIICKECKDLSLLHNQIICPICRTPNPWEIVKPIPVKKNNRCYSCCYKLKKFCKLPSFCSSYGLPNYITNNIYMAVLLEFMKDFLKLIVLLTIMFCIGLVFNLAMNQCSYPCSNDALSSIGRNIFIGIIVSTCILLFIVLGCFCYICYIKSCLHNRVGLN